VYRIDQATLKRDFRRATDFRCTTEKSAHGESPLARSKLSGTMTEGEFTAASARA
jgi:hypothetical protein